MAHRLIVIPVLTVTGFVAVADVVAVGDAADRIPSGDTPARRPATSSDLDRTDSPADNLEDGFAIDPGAPTRTRGQRAAAKRAHPAPNPVLRQLRREDAVVIQGLADPLPQEAPPVSDGDPAVACGLLVDEAGLDVGREDPRGVTLDRVLRVVPESESEADDQGGQPDKDRQSPERDRSTEPRQVPSHTDSYTANLGALPAHGSGKHSPPPKGVDARQTRPPGVLATIDNLIGWSKLARGLGAWRGGRVGAEHRAGRAGATGRPSWGGLSAFASRRPFGTPG